MEHSLRESQAQDLAEKESKKEKSKGPSQDYKNFSQRR